MIHVLNYIKCFNLPVSQVLLVQESHKSYDNTC